MKARTNAVEPSAATATSRGLGPTVSEPVAAQVAASSLSSVPVASSATSGTAARQDDAMGLRSRGSAIVRATASGPG